MEASLFRIPKDFPQGSRERLGSSGVSVTHAWQMPCARVPDGSRSWER